MKNLFRKIKRKRNFKQIDRINYWKKKGDQDMVNYLTRRYYGIKEN